MPKAPTVFVVDDDVEIRALLAHQVSSAGLEVETFASAEDFLKSYDPEKSGCLILDQHMPGLSGLALQAKMSELPYSPPVILLTGRGDVPTTAQAMKAGALDVLEKPWKPEVLLDMILQALQKDVQRRQESETRQEIQKRMATLSSRELEVLNFIVGGLANKVVAKRLNLSEKMVEVHRAHVVSKMQAHSFAELMRFVLLVQPRS